MRRKIVQTSSAARDLAECAEYYAQLNVGVAKRFLRAAKKTFAQLAKTPYLGVEGEYPSPRLINVRRWRIEGFEAYQIFYRVLNDRIEIVRVIHGARDIPAAFEENPNES